MRARRIETGWELGLATLLLALALVAWLVTDRRMAGMDAGPWTDLGSLGFFVPSWVVMTAAMMLPSLVPTTLIHARATRAGGPSV